MTLAELLASWKQEEQALHSEAVQMQRAAGHYAQSAAILVAKAEVLRRLQEQAKCLKEPACPDNPATSHTPGKNP